MNAPNKPYARLREALSVAGIDQSDIARTLNTTVSSISSRMNCKLQWKLDECYAILDMLGFLPSMLPVLFPRGGYSQDTEESRKEDKRALIMAALKELV